MSIPDLTGSTLGTYRLLEKIGQGGMATIYKAYQPAMDRLVAVKVLRSQQVQDPRVVERFANEARIITRLEHRNIVPVYDFGQEGDALYLVMRYLRGGTVGDLMKHSQLGLADTANLMVDVCAALDHAHSLNIVHRDIKPNNIIVDAEGHAYLTDFGLAKVLGESLELTLSGTAIGTPAYMAPEQVEGVGISPQTDIYALGVMLYEILTGVAPFESDSPMAVAMMHLHGPQRLPREINPAIPAAAELVIKRAMAQDPRERYQNAGELADDLVQAAKSADGDFKSGAGILPGSQDETLIVSLASDTPPTGSSEEAARKSHLAVIAEEIAAEKTSEELTPEIRQKLKYWERAARRKRILSRAPWIAAAILVISLGSALALTLQDLVDTRSAASGTSTAVQLLILELDYAQTALAKGDPGSEATLTYLQTQIAAFSITGSTGTVSPTTTPTFTTTPTPINPTETDSPSDQTGISLTATGEPSPTMAATATPDPINTKKPKPTKKPKKEK